MLGKLLKFHFFHLITDHTTIKNTTMVTEIWFYTILLFDTQYNFLWRKRVTLAYMAGFCPDM